MSAWPDEGPGEVEGRLRRFDGEYRWFLFRFEPLRDESGKIVNWCGINTDIDDRKRTEALLAGEKRLLEMVATGRPLPVVLNALCELVEETIHGCCCGIVLVESSGTHLQHGAAPTLAASYNDSINGRPVNVEAGPCAMAVALNAQVICADAPSETRGVHRVGCARLSKLRQQILKEPLNFAPTPQWSCRREEYRIW